MEDRLKKLSEALTRLEDKITDTEKTKEKLEKTYEAIIANGAVGQTQGTSTTSLEQKALASFGCSSVKELLHVNTCAPRFKNVPIELKLFVMDLKRDVDVSRMIQQRVNGEPADREFDGIDSPTTVKGVVDNYYGKNILAPKIKAFGTGVAGGGLEWLETVVSSQFVDEYELERLVAQMFRSLNLPSSPFKLTVKNGVTTARIQSENSTLTGSNFGTANLQFDAVKLAEFYPLPEELNEDSAPDILAAARAEVGEAIMRAIETAIINGDDDGTHIDNDTQGGAADLAEKAWKGLRALALANSANGSTTDFAGAAATAAKVRDVRAAMGKFGVNPRELGLLASPKVYAQLLALPEVSTVEKFGPQATILQGRLAAIDGMPITVSEFMRDDLDATGVNSLAGPNDKSALIIVNHRRFYLGTRRAIRTRAVSDLPSQDRWLIGAWWRGDYQGHSQSASEVSVSYGINIA